MFYLVVWCIDKGIMQLKLSQTVVDTHSSLWSHTYSHRVTLPPHFSYMPRKSKNYGHTKACTWIFIELYSQLLKTVSKPKYTPSGGWTNRLWHIHTTKGTNYGLRKQMTIISMLLTERSHITKVAYYMSPKNQKGQTYKDISKPQMWGF